MSEQEEEEGYIEKRVGNAGGHVEDVAHVVRRQPLSADGSVMITVQRSVPHNT
jgi:hypothetical protein